MRDAQVLTVNTWKTATKLKVTKTLETKRGCYASKPFGQDVFMMCFLAVCEKRNDIAKLHTTRLKSGLKTSFAVVLKNLFAMELGTFPPVPQLDTNLHFFLPCVTNLRYFQTEF